MKYQARKSRRKEIYRDREERYCRQIDEDRNAAGEDIIRAEREAIIRDMMDGVRRWGGYYYG